MSHVYARHTVSLGSDAYWKYFDLWRSGELSQGDSIIAFEKAFAKYCGAAACLAVASARAGFYMTLKVLDIGDGDEVIMPAYTFPSMPAAVIAAGARPIFVDADPETFNIDPLLAKEAVTAKTKAIVAAHLFGQSADVAALRRLADENGIFLLEDCAHSAGAKSGDARVGSACAAGFFSFGIGKNMPCFGGGAVTFDDTEKAGKLRRMVNSSQFPDDFSIHKKVLSSLPSWLLTRPGIFPWTLYVGARVLSDLGSDAMDRSVEEPVEETTKFSLRSLGRMSNLQAAVGLDQLEKLPERNATLSANGRRLAEKLQDVATVKAPLPVEDESHIYLYFRILVPEAPLFRKLLLKRGVDTQRDDMRNCAGLDAFKRFAVKCPIAESLPETSIELPNNPFMTLADCDYIAEAVRMVAEEISGGSKVESA